MMMSTKRGIVSKIDATTRDITHIKVLLEGEEAAAINYNQLTGEIAEGDEVVLNTTAVELMLGTGGQHFVVHNLKNKVLQQSQSGHIMKLRYTPYQLKVMSVEEQDSPYHKVFNDFQSLQGFPVLVGTLHSMLLPVAATLKYINPHLNIAYIMTDAAALPIALSDNVRILKEKTILKDTITIGHAFGGDYECVNIYNALITAKEIARCDLAIVTMGPGIVGTATPYGFSGIEQGMLLDAVNDLGGMAIGIPRISFADERERHRGISHHSITVFSKITKTKSNMVLPKLEEMYRSHIMEQINELQLFEKHYIVEESGDLFPDVLRFFELEAKTMGRGHQQDKCFFLTGAASAVFTNRLFGMD